MAKVTKQNKIPPIHPGEILQEEFLEPMKISQYRIAKEIGVAAMRISEIIHGKRSITADTAFRLGKFFGMSPQFWLGLQMDYDLEVVRDKIEAEGELDIKLYRDASQELPLT